MFKESLNVRIVEAFFETLRQIYYLCIEHLQSSRPSFRRPITTPHNGFTAYVEIDADDFAVGHPGIVFRVVEHVASLRIHLDLPESFVGWRNTLYRCVDHLAGSQVFNLYRFHISMIRTLVIRIPLMLAACGFPCNGNASG